MLLGLGLVLFERGFEILRLRRLRHLRQGAQDFVLGEIDVLEGVVKEFLQVFFAGYGRCSSGLLGCLANWRREF